MIKILSGNKKVFFPDFSCTHGRMCVYGRQYAPVSNLWLIATYHLTTSTTLAYYEYIYEP